MGILISVCPGVLSRSLLARARQLVTNIPPIHYALVQLLQTYLGLLSRRRSSSLARCQARWSDLAFRLTSAGQVCISAAFHRIR